MKVIRMRLLESVETVHTYIPSPSHNRECTVLLPCTFSPGSCFDTHKTEKHKTSRCFRVVIETHSFIASFSILSVLLPIDTLVGVYTQKAKKKQKREKHVVCHHDPLLFLSFQKGRSSIDCRRECVANSSRCGRF